MLDTKQRESDRFLLVVKQQLVQAQQELFDELVLCFCLVHTVDLHREGALWNNGQCQSVRLSVCRMPWPNLRTKRPRKPKIGWMEAHHTGNLWTYLEVKRSRSPGWLMLSQTMQVEGVTIFLKLACCANTLRTAVTAKSLQTLLVSEIVAVLQKSF